MEELKIVHRSHRLPYEIDSKSKEVWVVWKTCMRQVAITYGDQDYPSFFQKGDKFLCGEEAYRFCLETISGLHSPMVGETEVLGQFKEFFENFIYPATPAGVGLRRFVQRILADSKSIRESVLRNLGSQTYGSVLRRKLKTNQTLGIVGAGVLAKSILPWVINANDTKLIVRDINSPRVKEVQEKHDKISIFELKSLLKDSIEVLVLAAPLSSRSFKDWLVKQNLETLSTVIDLRENSQTDKIDADSEKIDVVTLEAFFQEIENNQTQVSMKVKEAFDLARELSSRRVGNIQVRPFGWEDLCV